MDFSSQIVKIDLGTPFCVHEQLFKHNRIISKSCLKKYYPLESFPKLYSREREARVPPLELPGLYHINSLLN